MSQDMITYSKQLAQYSDSFARVLPSHMSIDKLTRMAESAARINPALLTCERGSLMRSIMTGAILGLEIDGVTGQAFLVPYRDRVQLIVGYKGYITLAFNSGYLLEGRVVRQNDRFEFEYGLHPKCVHSYQAPHATDEQRGPIVAAYSVARNSEHQLSSFRVVMLDHIHKIRDNSQAYKYAKSKGKDTPWISNFEEMAKKTAIRAHADELPLNVQRAIALEQKHDDTGQPTSLNEAGAPVIDSAETLTQE